MALYLCRRHTGLKLKDIDLAFGVGESAVTQAAVCLTDEMERNEPLRVAVEALEAKLVHLKSSGGDS
jgi:chromosomal replication initiation ATPase DnaA